MAGNPKHWRVEWFNDDVFEDTGEPFNTWSDYLHPPFDDRRAGTADRAEAERWAVEYAADSGREARVVAVDHMHVYEGGPDRWWVGSIDRDGITSFYTSAMSTTTELRSAVAFRTKTAACDVLGSRPVLSTVADLTERHTR